MIGREKFVCQTGERKARPVLHRRFSIPGPLESQRSLTTCWRIARNVLAGGPSVLMRRTSLRP